jgi:hypothetical protein
VSGEGFSLEGALADALRQPDAVAAFEALARDPRLEPDERDALRHAHPDGVAMAALLVARLRFERLAQGSPEGDALLDDGGRRLVDAFRRYHAEVSPRARDALAERAAFDAWCDGQGHDPRVPAPGD